MKNARVLIGALTALLVVVGASEAQRERPLRVLVDLTHEYTTEWSDLGRVLDPERFHVTGSFASVSDEVLTGQDIAVVYYNRLDTEWNAVMTESAKAFVRRGGSLLVLAHGGHWVRDLSAEAAYPVYQANRLSGAFGFWFEIDPARNEVRSPVRLAGHALSEGLSEYATNSAPGILTDRSGSAEAVLLAEDGSLVLGVKRYGRGRVAACSDPGGLLPGGPNHALLEAVLEWLGPTEPREPSPLPPAVIWPEVRMQFREVRVAVPGTVMCDEEQCASFNILLRDVGQAVEELYGRRCYEALTVAVLPLGATARMPGATVVTGVTCDDLFPLLYAFAEAISRSLLGTGRLPGSFHEGLVHHLALDALTALGYPQAAVMARRYEVSLEEANALDLRTADPIHTPEDPELQRLAFARALKVLGQIETEYGPATWKRLAQLKWRDGQGNEDLDAEAFVSLLEEAWAHDIRSFLRARGVDVPGDRPPRFGQ